MSKQEIVVKIKKCCGNCIHCEYDKELDLYFCKHPFLGYDITEVELDEGENCEDWESE